MISSARTWIGAINFDLGWEKDSSCQGQGYLYREVGRHDATKAKTWLGELGVKSGDWVATDWKEIFCFS